MSRQSDQSPFPVLSLVAAAALAVSAQVHSAQEVTFSIDSPFLDRWNYPWNQSPGDRATAPVFSSYLETEFFSDPHFGEFDERDGQFHVGFKTDDHVEPGLGEAAYTITSARVTMMTASHQSFRYSLALPLWQWYRPPDDPEFLCPIDPGNGNPCPPGNTVIPTPALKLFGVGFRNGHDALSYQENTPYSPFGPWGAGHRTTYALDFDDQGQPRDVSNNVADGFDPYPFALGTTSAVALGQLVPSGATFTFELDVDDPYVQHYLREGLDLGILHFMVATLHITEQEAGGGSPEFYCKESVLVQSGFASAAGLELTVSTGKLGDLDGNGVVNIFDLLIVLAEWGECEDGKPCKADVNKDGVVNIFDLLVVLANWG